MFTDDTVAGSWPALCARVDAGPLDRWQREPALAGAETCAEIATRFADADGRNDARADVLLRALLRLAGADGPADDDALLLVLHLLSGRLRGLARRLRSLGSDPLALVVGEAACQVRQFDARGWGGSAIASLVLETSRQVLREHPKGGEQLLDRSALRLLDRRVLDPFEGPGLDVIDLLMWAVRSGVDAADVRLLIETECARDSGVQGADRIVARRHGVTATTLYNRRARALAALRAVAPAYLAAVA